MTADLHNVATAYGAGTANKIAKLVSIGKSYEGRPIWAIKISDHPNRDENEPEILIECNMHAREHLTAEQCLYLVHLLTDNYGQPTALGQRVTNIVNTPRDLDRADAQSRRRRCSTSAAAAFHGWRKNRQANPGSTKIGIDLNRNWSYMWGCCSGSGPNPKSLKYRGQYPFEAVENQVLRDFILSRRVGGVQQIKEVLNVHSYGEPRPVPVRLHQGRRAADMTADDHDDLRRAGQEDGVAQRLQGHAGQRHVHLRRRLHRLGLRRPAHLCLHLGDVSAVGLRVRRFPSARHGHRRARRAAT